MLKEQKIAEIKEIVRDYLESKFYFYMFINLSTGDIWSKEFISENDYIVYHDSLIEKINLRDYLELAVTEYNMTNDEIADNMSNAIYKDYFERD